MRFHAIATDYDGTLARDGQVDSPTIFALEQIIASKRKLILVTGRELDDLKRIFPQLDLFESVVAENGALLYRPRTDELKVLAPAPPEHFLRRLRALRIKPLSCGYSIIATVRSHEEAVQSSIDELQLRLQVVTNRDAVMVLPQGTDKAAGLQAALADTGLAAHNIVGIGDAENDSVFLRLCGRSMAVANALPGLKQMVDQVTRAAYGAGVVEVIEHLLVQDP